MDNQETSSEDLEQDNYEFNDDTISPRNLHSTSVQVPEENETPAKVKNIFQAAKLVGAIHSTTISGNFGPKLNGSVRSNRKSFEKTGPPFEVEHFSRSDRLEFWLNGSRPVFASVAADPGDFSNRLLDSRTKKRPTNQDIININANS